MREQLTPFSESQGEQMTGNSTSGPSVIGTSTVGRQPSSGRLSVEDQLRMSRGKTQSDERPLSQPSRVPLISSSSGKTTRSSTWWTALQFAPVILLALVLTGRYMWTRSWTMDYETTIIFGLNFAVLFALGMRQWVMERKICESINYLRSEKGNGPEKSEDTVTEKQIRRIQKILEERERHRP